MQKKFLSTIAFACAMIAVPAVGSAQPGLVGTWHGTATVNNMACGFDRVIGANGRYSEIVRCGPYATSQSGRYTVFPNHRVSFTVTDFEPKQRYIVGAQPGTGHYEANATPSGGTFRYSFPTPNTMVWQDVNLGGTITYRRLR